MGGPVHSTGTRSLRGEAPRRRRTPYIHGPRVRLPSELGERMPSSLPSRFIDRVYRAVCDTVVQKAFDPLLVGFVEAFETLGVSVDRMQIPPDSLAEGSATGKRERM